MTRTDQVTLHIVPSYVGNSYSREVVEVTPAMPMIELLDVPDASFPFAAFQPMTDQDQPDSPPDEARVIYPGSGIFGVTKGGLLTAAYDLTWADFLRGAEAGLIEGNPYELLVYIDRGTAGGGPVELIPVVQWLWDNREVLQFSLELGASAIGLEEAVRRAILWLPKRRRGAIAKSFRERGITSLGLVAFIDRRPFWDPARLSELLALTVPEASALLEELGYEVERHGLYVRSERPEAQLRRAAFLAGAHGSPDTLDEAGKLPKGEKVILDRWSWDLPEDEH